MSEIRISGRLYPERPPSKLAKEPRVRRLSLIVDSLKFAYESLEEPERKLYKSVCEVHAHAANLLDQVRGESQPQLQLSDLTRHELEP